MPAGACSGVKTASAICAPRLRLAVVQLVAHLAPRQPAVLGLDDDAQLRAVTPLRVDGQQEVALLRAHDIARCRPGPLDDVAGTARRVRRASASSRSSKSRPWRPTWTAPRRAPPATPRCAARRSLSFSKPWVISLRNWWSGEPRRVGSSSWASRDASPSKYAPSSVRIRPIALSRFVSSNRSVTKRFSWPRSPRKRSSVRGRRPSLVARS